MVNELRAVVRELGGEHALGRALSSDHDLRNAIREGFAPAVVEELMRASGLTLKELASALDLSSRSLQRRRRSGRLAAYESDRLYRLARIIAIADEYLGDFQARIFLHGKIQAEVPLRFVDAIRVVKPIYVDYFPATHSWNATYLPVYAALRAVFQSVNLQSLLNPFLAAITILALYACARNIWPESKTHAVIAIALLASSSQFLIMSMTAYAMPAHLALNTIWLWLYSQSDRRAFYLAPFVGALAIGLHQPIVHALFVLPFLARLVFG